MLVQFLGCLGPGAKAGQSSRPELPEGFATPGLQVGLLPVKVTSSLFKYYTLIHRSQPPKAHGNKGEG